MKERTRTLAAGVLVPAALALASCGGDGPPSREDFARELDDVCADIEEKLQSIDRPDSPGEFASRFDEVRVALRSSIGRMRELERPEGEAGVQAEEYVDKVSAAIEDQFLPAFDQLERAVRSRDQGKIRAAAARIQAIDEDETRELARELGAEDCAAGQ